jgi:hypothetical protein
MQKLAVFGGTGSIGRSIIEYLDTQDDWQSIRPLAKVVAGVLWGLNKGDRKKRVSDRLV